MQPAKETTIIISKRYHTQKKSAMHFPLEPDHHGSAYVLVSQGLGSPSTSVPISTSMVDMPRSPGVTSTLNLDIGQN